MANDKTNSKSSAKGKRKRPRPAAKPMPPQIPDTPENVARALFNAPPSANKNPENGNG